MPELTWSQVSGGLFAAWACWLSYTVVKFDTKLTAHLAFHAGMERAAGKRAR